MERGGNDLDLDNTAFRVLRKDRPLNIRCSVHDSVLIGTLLSITTATGRVEIEILETEGRSDIF